jgi:hypothetical protein
MSFSVALCEHGIDTSDASLIVVLHGNDPQLRIMAAGQLAENHDSQAIRALLDALPVENDINVNIFIAASLLGRGYTEGARRLEAICSDPSQSVDAIVRATRSIVTAQFVMPQLASSAKCTDVVLAAFDRASDTNQRIDLILLLAGMVRYVPQEKAVRMVAIEQNLLQDKEIRIRLQAGYALSLMGSTASIGLLREVIQRDENTDIRTGLQMDLNSLLKLQQTDSASAQASQLYSGYGSAPLAGPPKLPDRCKFGPGIDLATQRRMKTAADLAHAGDPAGGRQLESMCSDASLPVNVIASTAMTIETTEWQQPGLASAAKCVDTVLAAFDRTNVCSQQIQLISLFPAMSKEVPSDKVDQMTAIVQNLLSDESPAVRLLAAGVLTRMNSTASIGPIRSILQNETDPFARTQLQRDIDTLQKLQQQGANPAPTPAPPQ